MARGMSAGVPAQFAQSPGLTHGWARLVGWFFGCLTSQQHASVSHGQICPDNCTCCHTKMEVADQTFSLTQSHYTDTGSTSPSADPMTLGPWQGSHWSPNYEVMVWIHPEKSPRRKWEANPGSAPLEADALTTRPTRWCMGTRNTVHKRKTVVMIHCCCQDCFQQSRPSMPGWWHCKVNL